MSVRTNKLVAAMLGVSFAVLPFVSAGAVELLTNGGFETGNFSGWTLGGNPTSSGVYTSGTSLGSFGFGADYSIAHSGTYAAEYSGSGSNTFTLTQTITTSAGLATISGFIGSNTPTYSGGFGGNDFATIDGLSVTSYAGATPSNGSFNQFMGTAQLTAGVHTVVFSFANSGSGANGFSIDDLSVSQATPVPEPAALVLFGVGLAGLGLVRRRA